MDAQPNHKNWPATNYVSKSSKEKGSYKTPCYETWTQKPHVEGWGTVKVHLNYPVVESIDVTRVTTDSISTRIAWICFVVTSHPVCISSCVLALKDIRLFLEVRQTVKEKGSTKHSTDDDWKSNVLKRWHTTCKFYTVLDSIYHLIFWRTSSDKNQCSLYTNIYMLLKQLKVM